MFQNKMCMCLLIQLFCVVDDLRFKVLLQHEDLANATYQTGVKRADISNCIAALQLWVDEVISC